MRIIGITQSYNHMNKIYFKSISIILMLFCVISAFAQQTDSVKYIKAGRFIDTEKGRILTNQIIVVDHDTIKAVGDNISIPTGAKVIDLSNATVLPGLIDCHTHLSQQPGDNYYDDIFRKSAVDYAVIAPIYTKRTLLAGFTTCRDVGAAAFIDIALRNAINHGDIPGPRMLCATLFIGSTGSHGDLNGFSPYLDWVGPKQMSGVANGVDEVRKQVRYNIKYGAEVIKFGASAGVLSEEESVGAPQFTQEEMNAIVDEAHLWGLKACAHAHGTIAIKMAVKAGVASIEHGSFLDDEAIALMKQHGTYLVADIYNDDYILSDYAKHGTPEKIINKERLVGKTQRLSFQKAVKAGVKIAFGTDAGVYPHGWNGKQFKYMVKYGLTPMQAIQSATYNAADLLGWQAKVGSIAKGKYADLIAVKTDPLTDITSLENVSFVMKGGEVYKDELHP
ncbi:Imidazolonepropionase [Mucilaginibacter lappiensis]|nr:Imidazolonepropionase [Mucilaginibacter lappiensis]